MRLKLVTLHCCAVSGKWCVDRDNLPMSIKKPLALFRMGGLGSVPTTSEILPSFL